MGNFTAFLDACVLVPVAQCDTLLRFAAAGAFRPLWSQRVVDESLSALQRIHPDIDPNRFFSRFRSMNEAFDDALVSGWESLELLINLPDPKDSHVVKAALRGHADVIVTNNIKDFPDNLLRPLGLEAIHLDDFLLDLFDLNPAAACRVIREQAQAMTKPTASAEELLTKFRQPGVAPKFAHVVSEMLRENLAGRQD